MTSQMRADARANRARLVDAARELFSERGLEVDVREVCERAGVGMGTLYRNFATKDDLIDAVQEEAVAGLQRLIADGLDQREGTVTEDLIQSWLAFGEQYGRIGPTLRQRTRARAGGSDPEWVTALRERGLDAWRSFQARGLMRDDVPPEFLQEVFDSLLFGYQGMRQRWDAESISAWLSTILLEGVRPPANA